MLETSAGPTIATDISERKERKERKEGKERKERREGWNYINNQNHTKPINANTLVNFFQACW
jgi:hypothetical protein